ncbi:zinc-binding alcohol dehydrogenase family protein [Phanerochaete sordida]|uniref:Zinc-binding alcohol dehydrogenase family protein n=1 Tax=Phanerochaete sordida TaxID=48140 RepID=A0A9P3G8P5_9APHY|nr:zinc-binding alcohol dehydrogenase family protein [Phanerochaete sordida]
MTTQKALFLEKIKGKLFIQDRDIQEAETGEVLVEIHATALNPVDWKIQGIEGFLKEFPAVFGSDASGVVKKVGAGVTNVSVGDKVLFQGAYDNRHATFQQYAIVAAEIVAKIPENLSFEQASTIPVTLATAAVGLYSPKPLGVALDAPWEAGGRGKYAGEPIVVIGGSSSVGQQVIQFAKLSGFSPIITTASLHNSAFLKTLGATHVIDRAAPLSELTQAVQAITSKPVTVVYDAISYADTQNAAYDVLAPGGTLLVVLNPAVDAGKITPKKAIVHVLGSVQLPNNRAVGRRLYANLTGLLDAGEIKPNHVEVLPNGLAGIPGGLEKLEAGVSALKLVARPQDNI